MFLVVKTNKNCKVALLSFSFGFLTKLLNYSREDEATRDLSPKINLNPSRVRFGWSWGGF